MSYILDALRKSEAERRQGKAPDLGQPVQMVYRAKRKPISAVVWIALALFVNAGVLAYLFWPETVLEVPVSQGKLADPDGYSGPAQPEEVPTAEPVAEVAPTAPAPGEQERAEAYEAPMVIVPSRADEPPEQKIVLTERVPQGRVPHLVELPLSFQKSVPDLTFNSHIVSSDPSASRVMINGHYLKAGDRFGSLSVERITDDGVVLSMDGRPFRVGTVRDWLSPQ
ncbi:general secretion pathway protein GspB [Marinobacter sp. VGCF2001]|uniref:general secretion pathway protein GspB n=1 Tax=Marinobacter sp. VGCF2001 TaxID=3417189 RepID=UPI003CF15922